MAPKLNFLAPVRRCLGRSRSEQRNSSISDEATHTRDTSGAQDISQPSTAQQTQSQSAEVLPSSQRDISDARVSAAQAGDFLPREEYHYRSPVDTVSQQPELAQPDADQLRVDVLEEELNRIDTTHQSYVQRLRELSQLCGSLGRLPRCYVLPKKINLSSRYPHSHGGFSDVWKGRYGDGWVAVKVIRVHAGDQLALKKAFYSEAIYWKRLNHPHIVRFLGISSIFYLAIVSEWMSNGDLPSYLGVHPEAELLPLIMQVASAMEYMHSSHVVHGDIKGGNILINICGQACLADFGLTVTVYRTQSLAAMSSGTGLSACPGTIRWSAPERLMPTDDPRHTMPTMASDVYSFGIMMWEVYTRKLPFDTFLREWLVIPQIVNGVRPPQLPQIPGFLWLLMKDCWTQERRDRPSSVNVSMRLQEEFAWQSPATYSRNQEANITSGPQSSQFGTLDPGQHELRPAVSFKQAALGMTKEFSGLCPPLKHAITELLAAMEDIEKIEGVQGNFTYASQRLTNMQVMHQKQKSELAASKRMKRCLDVVVRVILMVEKTIRAKADRGIFKRIDAYPNDISAVSSAICMLGDVADCFVRNMADSTKSMVQDQVFDQLTFVATAHFLSIKTGRQCTEGTRTELLTDLLTWGTAASGVPKVCLLTGPAGSGKSTIAYTVCSLLQELDLLGGSFFCSRHDDDKRRSTQHIFSTLARSLASYDRDFASALVQVLKSGIGTASSVAAEQLVNLLIKPIRNARPFQNSGIAPIRVLIIDALDECADEEKAVYELLHMLLAEVDQLPLKFLITSRPESRISQVFDQAELSRYDVHRIADVPRDVARGDVLTYLRSELNQCAQACQVPDGWPPNAQVEMLADHADTLFVYASTVSKYIWNLDDDVAQRLDELTILRTDTLQGINSLYKFVLDKVKHSNNDVTWEITCGCLQALIRSQCPLALIDLADLMNADCQQLRIALAGLQSVINVPSDDHNAIIIFHASFPDYLVGNIP